MNWIEEKVTRLGREIYEDLIRARDWNESTDDMEDKAYEWEASAERLWKEYKKLLPAIALDIEKEYESK